MNLASPEDERQRRTSSAPPSRSKQALVQAVLGRSARLLDATNNHNLCLNALTTARDLLGLDACQIAVLTPDKSLVDLYAAAGRGEIVHRCCPTDVGLTAHVMRDQTFTLLNHAQLCAVAHVQHDAVFLGDGIHDVALTPLWGANSQISGALFCGTKRRDGYNDDEMVAIRMFGLHLGAALELLQARWDLQHWSAIVRSSHAPILGIDLQGKVTHWNPAAERLYGYDAEEAIGQHIRLIVPPDKREELDQILSSIAASKGVQNLETVRVSKAGRKIYVALTISPILDASGRPVGASSVAQDITQQKTEQAQLYQVVEAAPNAMVLTDERNRIILVNAEAERLFGFTRDELFERSIETLLPPGTRAQHRQHRARYQREPQQRAMAVDRELWALTKNGTRIPVEIDLNPIHGPTGRMVLASIVDISERRKRERERQRLLREAQEAVEARDTFLSIASHELKTPLTALQLTTQGLLRTAKKQGTNPWDGRLEEKLQGATRQVVRLGKLIDQLLDVSRITAKRLKLEPSRTELSGLVRDVLERFDGDDAPEIIGPKVTEVWGVWDSGRIDQIVTNLVANAVKYGDGKPVEVELIDEPQSVVLAVRDHGHGIAPADQARIFDRFERLVSHRNYGGFGLGLWIVRQLVDAHGGQIEVVSQRDHGSTFSVILPKYCVAHDERRPPC